MADLNKIIRVLDLSQSSTRDETLKGIVKFIIYSKQDVGIDKKNITSEIARQLTIQIHEHEVEESINYLLDNGFIEKIDESLFNSRTGSKSRTWRLTWLPYKDLPPTNDWEN